MGYKRRNWIFRIIATLLLIGVCIFCTSIASPSQLLQGIVPFTTIFVVGAAGLWLDHKFLSLESRFGFIRIGLIAGAAIASGALAAMLLNPRSTNFEWYYPFIVSIVIGIVTGVIVPVSGYVNWKAREALWDKRPRNYTKPK
jgi:hypothetical protein